MSKIICHIDLNKFFVRCAEILDPSIIGKPVGIGSEGRSGIISTCSYEARKFGVKSGMPTFKALKLCPSLILIEPNFKFIELMSNEFFSFIKQYSTNIEKLSCDECFVDFTDFYNKNPKIDFYDFLKKLQKELFKKTKLYCSIGVGPTLFLAKMASDYKKPNGITIIRKKDIKKYLFPLKVECFFGIGQKTYPKLNKINIITIGDLYYEIKRNNPELNSILFQEKKHILDCLEGKSSSNLNINPVDQKSYGISITLPYNMSDIKEITPYFDKEVSKILKNINDRKLYVKTITITYKNSKIENGSFKLKTFSKTFKEYSNDLNYIKKISFDLLNSTYKNFSIRLIGYTLKNLKRKEELTTQMTFDNYEYYEKENSSLLLVNDLNRKFKKDVLFLGSSLKNKK